MSTFQALGRPPGCSQNPPRAGGWHPFEIIRSADMIAKP